jgi:hypothetical protein
MVARRRAARVQVADMGRPHLAAAADDGGPIATQRSAKAV